MNLKLIISNPLFVFLSIWTLILFTFQLRISHIFPEHNINQILFPILSIFYFILGFLIVKFFHKNNKKNQVFFELHFLKKRFNLFIYFLLIAILFIVLFNIQMFGLPPMMSFFGYDTFVYLEYGRLKGVLFALLIFLFSISIYATKKLSFTLKALSVLILLLYVSRGNIIFSILVYFFLLIYENKISNKKLSILSVSMIIFILLLFQVLGELRTGTEVFYDVLEIKSEYRIENSGLIWIISYISMPFVNFLEITNYDNLYYGQNIASRSLPAFLNFNSESVEFYKSILPNQYNTVSGYLSQVYLDFGVIGIIVYNFLLGIILSYVYYFTHNTLVKSILITSTSLLFFVDYFFFFTTIVLIFLSILFNKFVFKRRYILNDKNIHNNSNV